MLKRLPVAYDLPRRCVNVGSLHYTAFVALTYVLLGLFREAFDLFDTDGSGTIDAKELKVAMRYVNKGILCLVSRTVVQILSLRSFVDGLLFPEWECVVTGH